MNSDEYKKSGNQQRVTTSHEHVTERFGVEKVYVTCYNHYRKVTRSGGAGSATQQVLDTCLSPSQALRHNAPKCDTNNGILPPAQFFLEPHTVGQWDVQG